MRLRRLLADWEGMKRLAAESPLLTISWTKAPSELYVVTYRCKGLVKSPESGQLVITAFHQCEIYLHANYPRQQPHLTWLTEIFHPNILSHSRNGGVCIGNWTPAESLPSLCLRIGKMIQYRSYNPNDPLDLEAAEWARQNRDRLPIDDRALCITLQRPTDNHDGQLEVIL